MKKPATEQTAGPSLSGREKLRTEEGSMQLDAGAEKGWEEEKKTVMKMRKNGMESDAIARLLNKSVPEVERIIAMLEEKE